MNEAHHSANLVNVNYNASCNFDLKYVSDVGDLSRYVLLLVLKHVMLSCASHHLTLERTA